MKVGLVLGAGGVMGGAWLTGGLAALCDETGWDPETADVIVGTSAGSMIGSLIGTGVPPWFMVAHSRGESFDGLTDALGRPAAEADRSGGAVFRLHRGRPFDSWGSWRLLVQATRAPLRHTPAAFLSAFAPVGLVSTEPLKDIVRRTVPEGWAAHPGLWIMAFDYDRGRRVAFGREDAPPAELADAVAASCAIPGFYRPVDIGGRRYVDGGVRSPSNLDVVRGHGLDLVICLNPMSTRDGDALRGPLAGMRRDAGRRLGREARKLRDEGTEVVLVQPTAEDFSAMGPNAMSRRRRNEVIETARRTVGEQIRAATDQLGGLPEGEPHKLSQPEGDPSTWPDIGPPKVQQPAAR